MKILAVDSATFALGVALLEDEQVVWRWAEETRRGHAGLLTPKIEEGLAAAGWTLQQLDGLCCTRGPGAYTSLRVGMATLMGLAYALDRPIAAAGTLEVLATNGAELAGDGDVLAVLDVRQQAVAVGLYELDAQGRPGPSKIPLAARPPAQVLEDPAVQGPLRIVGDGPLRHPGVFEAALPDATFGGQAQAAPRPEAVGRLCRERLATGGEPLFELEPIYTRPAV